MNVPLSNKYDYNKGQITRQTMFILILGAILGVIVSANGNRKPCEYTVMESVTSIKYNSSLDADITFMFFKNQSGCEIDLSGLYKNLSGLYSSSSQSHRDEIFISLKIFCYEKAEGNNMHFPSSMGSNGNQSSIKVGVQLALRSCSVFMNELQIFQHYGRIWSIVQPNTSMIYPDSDCSSLTDLQILASCLPCDRNNKSAIARAERFFWELCSEPLRTVFNLQLEGCFQTQYEVKQNLLQDMFPKLQTLNLKYVNLTKTLVTYPWTNVYIDTPEKLYISYLTDHYESVVKNASSFPREIAISYSDVNISNVKFIGDISTISLNGINLKSLKDQSFSNVSGLLRLDLSYNDIEEIGENVFQKLSKLKYLHLRMNKLTVLTANVFNNLHNLLLLDLSNNKIRILNQRQFKHLVKLEEVNMEHNEITQLPDNFLQDQIRSLRIVKLSWNPLEKIPVYPLYADGVTKICISHCRINSSGVQALIESLNPEDLTASYISNSVRRLGHNSSPGAKKKLLRRAYFDLSYNLIANIEQTVASESLMFKFQELIKTFYVKLNGNPIDCRCMVYIPDIISLTNKDSATLISWACMYPQELKGRLVSSVTRAETYCPVSIENCPERCSCFQRENGQSTNQSNNTANTYIVDCRNINITSLPVKMPLGKLELWFQNANLTKITSHKYLRNTTVFDASHNRINVLTAFAATDMTNLSSLKLDHNNLTRLPVQIVSTKLRQLTLGNNPFLCDCHTRWMKKWLLKRTNPVTDWNSIQCSYNTSKISQMISLSDSFFVCHSETTLNISEHIIFPSIVIGCTLFVLVSISLLIYFQRFTIKVLLFMRCGIHVFDRKKHHDANMEFDAFVIFSHHDSVFVQKNIINGLLIKGYTVCNLYKNLVIGLTFLDNIEQIINKSRKVIFSMTEDTFTDDLLMSAWNIAYERSINNFTDSIILVIDKEIVNTCEDMKLRKYVKSGKYIKRKSKILQSSVLYLMPKQTNDSIKDKSTEETGILLTEDIHGSGNNLDNSVYISYPDEFDDEIRKILIPDLQEKNYNVSIFENKFTPGTDIRDEIHEKLNQSSHFIFILSNENLKDEVKMFILSSVISKSTLCNNNYLLLFTSDAIVSSYLSNELENYLNKYATASMLASDFKARLLTALKWRKH